MIVLVRLYRYFAFLAIGYLTLPLTPDGMEKGSLKVHPVVDSQFSYLNFEKGSADFTSVTQST